MFAGWGRYDTSLLSFSGRGEVGMAMDGCQNWVKTENYYTEIVDNIYRVKFGPSNQASCQSIMHMYLVHAVLPMCSFFRTRHKPTMTAAPPSHCPRKERKGWSRRRTIFMNRYCLFSLNALWSSSSSSSSLPQSKLGGGGLCDTGTSTLGENGCAVMMLRIVCRRGRFTISETSLRWRRTSMIQAYVRKADRSTHATPARIKSPAVKVEVEATKPSKYAATPNPRFQFPRYPSPSHARF